MNREVLESLSSRDEGKNSKILKSIKGCVECRDKMGNLIFKKDNVITQSGKFFLLEKLLGIVGYGANTNGLKISRGRANGADYEPDYSISETLIDRQLAVFAIGNGAITTTSVIGEAKAPSYNDTDLFKYLLFKDDNENYESNTIGSTTFYYNQYVNDSVFQGNIDNNKINATTVSGNNVYTLFKFIDKYLTAPIKEESGTKKLSALSNAFKFVMNENEDDVHIEFSLTINETDLDGYAENNKKFNELGLFVVSVDHSDPSLNPPTGSDINGYIKQPNRAANGADVQTKSISNPELFSHITFNNMDLSSSQEVTFTYYIYIL